MKNDYKGLSKEQYERVEAVYKEELQNKQNEIDKLEEFRLAFNEMMEYWDSIADEEKPLLDKRLNDIFKLNNEEKS